MVYLLSINIFRNSFKFKHIQTYKQKQLFSIFKFAIFEVEKTNENVCELI